MGSTTSSGGTGDTPFAAGPPFHHPTGPPEGSRPFEASHHRRVIVPHCSPVGQRIKLTGWMAGANRGGGVGQEGSPNTGGGPNGLPQGGNLGDLTRQIDLMPSVGQRRSRGWRFVRSAKQIQAMNATLVSMENCTCGVRGCPG